jgi:dihydrofolate reductase
MNAIFAVNQLGGFGNGNTMPWPRSPGDLKRFKNITTGHTVVMGANTWLSDIPHPFPNRRNCVLSREIADDRCEVYRSVTDLMNNLSDNETVFVIGGVTILWLLRPHINRIYMTRFKSSQTASITMNTDLYLNGFTRTNSEDFGDHVFDIYDLGK